ncbi:hypothetical protein QFC21_003315 [Naganishia friedmannii]|uniref:Uncharacterized protein n=1 Tax=Naganishia friedmannii TaxID=89922 RepID=A0ACC2VQB1_9TREE|nr:hypothetical protein QFC21_003315 [Naganishia friedmannii]
MVFDTLLSPYVAIGTIFATFVCFRFFQPFGGRNAIPWAKTSIPFLGGAVEYGTDPVKFLVEQRKKVGDVFRVNLIVMKVTFVLGAKWNRWLLKEAKEEEVSFWEAIVSMHCGLINTSFYHPGWLDRSMKALSGGMNRPARVDKYSEGFIQVASDVFSKWERQPSVPLFVSGSDLLLRANMTALYGPRFVDRYATELIPIVRSFERAFVQPLTRVLPLWATPSGRELLRAYRRLKQVIEAEVNMRMKDLDHWKKEGDDYMTYLLTMDDKAEDFFDCYGEHLMILISASHVNTAGTFSWTLIHLLRNPDMLAEFEEEIKANPRVNGSYPIKNMPFSEACMRETGRLYTNLMMMRYIPQDVTTPEGIIIPKGWVAGSPIATQQDPELYDQPEKWDPRRFLPNASTSSYSSKFRNNEFVQFGYGKHACLGEKITHALLRASLWPELIDNYHVELVDGVVDGEGIDGVGVKPNYRENMGTPFGVREVNIKITKRAIRLSDQNA